MVGVCPKCLKTDQECGVGYGFGASLIPQAGNLGKVHSLEVIQYPDWGNMDYDPISAFESLRRMEKCFITASE